MKIASIVLLASCVFAQAPKQPAGSASSTGECSPAVTGSGNTINIQTCGMTAAQVEEWRNSFREILAKQIDPKVLDAVLDEIKSGQIRIENGVLRIERGLGEVRASIQPRRLSEQDKAVIAASMSPFARNGNGLIMALMNDVESVSYAIFGALQN